MGGGADPVHEGRDRLFPERAEGIDPLRAEGVHDGDAAQLAPPLAVGAEGHVPAAVEEATGGVLLRAAAEDVVLGLEHLLGQTTRVGTRNQGGAGKEGRGAALAPAVSGGGGSDPAELPSLRPDGLKLRTMTKQETAKTTERSRLE